MPLPDYTTDELIRRLQVSAYEFEHRVADRLTALQARNAELERDARRLLNEVRGSWGAFEPELRAAIGNTNYKCVADRAKELDAALAQAGQEAG